MRRMQREVVELLRGRDGHFVPESGHHGELWLDLELLFQWPERIRPLAASLAGSLAKLGVEAVCGPLVEGAFVGLLVASELHTPFFYSEPVRDSHSQALFPVTYRTPAPQRRAIHGLHVAVVNDVINAGSAR